MKATTKYTALMLGLVLAAASCTQVDYPDRFVQTSGVPKLDFIRYADKDVMITQANMEEVVCLVGENLTSIHDLYFNDQAAVLNTSYMTAKTLVVSVPKNMPVVQTDKIYMITKDSTVVSYDFKVLPPAPKVESMSLEWAQPGETVTINGSYLFAPVTVTFPGVDPVEAAATDGSSISLVVPEGAQPGKIKVTTASGTGQSVFMYKDSRGMLFNFDNDPHPDNHGWHAQVIETDATALSGNFLRFGDPTVTLDAEGGWNDANFSFEYWPGDWDEPVTYADSPRLTDFADFSAWNSMALKFELYIPSSNPWKSGAMQLIIGGVDAVTGGGEGVVDIDGNVTAGANNKFISGDGKPQAPRALWIPWKDSGSFDTGDKWITVTIPYSEFNKKSDGSANTETIKPETFTSLTIFVWSGGVTGTDCQPIMKIDNIRAVPIK
ncbi:MAG: hypothetical protein II454_05915 [Bacteroidales bacterium]|jgi:hypothetical protein|nr:hypothetical protein [Bacteroidales bacterium]